MAEYRQIYTKIWEKDWFFEQTPEGKVLWFYLLTNHRASVAGIYVLPYRFIAFETNLPTPTVDRLLKEFQDKGKILYDREVMWVTKLRDYQETTSPKVQIRIEKDIESIPDGPVKSAYRVKYPYPTDTLSGNESRVVIPERTDTETDTDTEKDTDTPVGADEVDDSFDASLFKDPVLPILREVKGYPFKAQEDAEYVAGLRVEFPTVDVTEVARQYAVWHTDNPSKTKNYRGRLRTFVKRAAERQPATPVVQEERHLRTDIDARREREEMEAEAQRNIDPNNPARLLAKLIPSITMQDRMWLVQLGSKYGESNLQAVLHELIDSEERYPHPKQKIAELMHERFKPGASNGV